MNINRVSISGHLSRDPETRSTPSGTKILCFSIAANERRYNGQTDEWEDYANFVDCVMFGKKAEFFCRHLCKGKLVYIDGRLRYSSWEKDGQRRSKLEVVIEDMDLEFVPRTLQHDHTPNQTTAQAQPVAAVPPQEDVYDEEVPF